MSAITPKAPMSRLSHQTVRTSWPAYLGAFVALVTGVVLIATTISLVGSVDATLDGRRRSSAKAGRSDLDVRHDVGLTVSGDLRGRLHLRVRGRDSTPRKLGLLRLIGATGRQIRRLVLGRSTVVALAAVVVGCLIATPLASPSSHSFVASLSSTSSRPAPWLAWAIAAPTGMVVALMGAWRSSRRAAKVPPSAALREAAVERSRPASFSG